MENHSFSKVCVTGGSGYLGSWLVKKLLDKGHTVHATLRNLDDTSKVGLLRSLPGADTRLVLFQADIYNPSEFELAIKGCQYVFHLATPLQHNTQSTQHKNVVEAAVAGVKSIADSCIRSESVKRLIYTSSVTALSPLKEDGTGYKSSADESCWTPLNLSYAHSNDFLREYTESKTVAEKEVLRYNDIENGTNLEVVTLACALVGGETILSYVPASMEGILSQIKGNLFGFQALQFLNGLLGSIPLVHIDDVCEAHIFCMEKPSMKGRFLCASTDTTISEMSDYYQEHYPEFNIAKELMGGPERGSRCDNKKLMNMGFKYRCGLKKILDDSVECGRRLTSPKVNSIGFAWK